VKGKSTAPRPLLVCVHGGGYTHRYFDVPGASLVEAGNSADFHVFSIDRPDHGGSRRLPRGGELIRRNGKVLANAIEELIERHAQGVGDVVLVGHSIGGAVSICTAALHPTWLAGVAVSGVGLTPHQWKWLPPLRRISIPKFMAVRKLFGPAYTFDREMAYSQMSLCMTKAVKQEMVEITTWWPSNLHSIAHDVWVPVDSAMGQHDALWLVTPENVQNFGAAFVYSPRVHADIVPGVGHCIEHHIQGQDLHARQLAFASACCKVRNRP
jgi:pimeloyl-ACP methyl ester carboxylesterase